MYKSYYQKFFSITSKQNFYYQNNNPEKDLKIAVNKNIYTTDFEPFIGKREKIYIQHFLH